MLSSLIIDLCKLLGMRKINTVAYHPQGNGLVENFNRTLQVMLGKHAKELGSSWELHLQQLLFAYWVRPTHMVWSLSGSWQRVLARRRSSKKSVMIGEQRR